MSFDFEKLSINEKKVLRFELETNLISFIRFFFKIIEGEKFIPNWHHAEIANELTNIYNRELDNLIINIPPRHSKTTMSCYFTAWSIARNPKSLFLYISGSEKLTNDNSRIVRSIIMHPIYKHLFGVTISADTSAKNHWRTNHGGGITAATIGGQITGFGAGNINDAELFYGAIIIDDPNKISESGSIVLSEIPNQRFIDTIRSRKNGNRTPIILIQQRVFVNDLSGFLLAGKGALQFKHVCFPILSKDNEPLWSERLGFEEIESIRTNPKFSFIFNAQYMQRPTLDVEGLVFPEPKLKRFKLKDLTDFDASISTCDVADAGDCYLSNPYAKIYKKKVFIVDVVHSDLGEAHTKSAIVSKFIKHKTALALFESNNQGGIFAKWVETLCKAENINTKVQPFYTQGNKDTRMIMYSDYVLQNFYFLDSTEYSDDSEYGVFMNHLTSLRKDGSFKLKDAGDAISSMAKYLMMTLK